MCVDVQDLVWVKIAVGKHVPHRSFGARSTFWRCDHVVGVSAHSVAGNLGNRVEPVGTSQRRTRKHQKRCRFGEYEAISMLIERPTCVGKVVECSRHRPEARKATRYRRCERRVSTAHEHNVEPATA